MVYILYIFSHIDPNPSTHSSCNSINNNVRYRMETRPGPGRTI